MDATVSTAHRERVVNVINGATVLFLAVLLFLTGAAFIVYGVETATGFFILAGFLILLVDVVIARGFFTLQPNEARVLVLFGSYKGTVRKDGFSWANPFYTNGPGQFSLQLGALQPKIALNSDHRAPSRNKISLRARTLNGGILKVNDLRGNPIEIAAVVVWHVADTAQAMFDVENYENFVATQSESALRHLANLYAYDDNNPEDTTLRRNVDEVSTALCKELTERLSKAGVAVDEARLTHLAYASEIAQVMLRSQQAEAVIAARQKIVHGAVSMVDMALKELADKHVVQLDDERRAAMVSNLMVVLCAESEVHPVVNAGTLYS
jgi:regulator of protease activity HflC (stomatin/prohibitin superfamily)